MTDGNILNTWDSSLYSLRSVDKLELKVYLSGGIAGLTYDEANAWRVDVTERLERVGIQTINPLRRRMFFEASDEEDITPNEIVTRDIQDVRDADLILVYLPISERFSVGTVCEIWEAYRLQKPIILVSDDPRYVKHPWMVVAITRIFGDLAPALKYLMVRWADMDEDMLPEKWGD